MKSTPFKVCFQKFLQDCNVPRSLSEFCVTDSDISQLVAHSFHPERFNNMVGKLTKMQVERIFNEIL